MERLTIVILLIAGLLTPAWVTAGPLQISLRAETTLQGDTIFLSHLLPPHVPEHIRNLAGNISLGAAPEPGKLRLLHAPFILSRLQANDLDPGFFTIPDTAIIHRGHLITKQQVLRAIRTAVRQRGGAVSNELDENEIELSTVVFTAQQNPRLAVDDIVADPQRSTTRFLMRVAEQPRTPDFSVSCPTSLVSAIFSGPIHGAPKLRPLSPIHQDPEITPRRVAHLHLHSTNYSALLEVRPLQSGKTGEAVRVRLLDNGRTLIGRVLGRDTLDASF
jgi:hypothetical protein